MTANPFRRFADFIDRKITEAQTCPGCGCNGEQWRPGCDCLHQGCACAGAEGDPNPDWEQQSSDGYEPDAARHAEMEPVPAAEPAPARRVPPPAYTPVDDLDDEARQVAQARNRALFLRRTATTEAERQEAEQAREDYIDELSAAVDRAFAERDRMWAEAGYDDPAAARQEDHAVQLLDQYNAEVQADMAEMEQRRAENLRRYREQRDAEWTCGRDAAAGASLPPPAEPYVPPSRPAPPPTTTSSGGSGMTTNVEGARAAIMRAHQDGQTGLAQLANAHESLGDAQNGLRHGTEGSNQPEADQAHAQLADAMNKIDEARSQVASALGEFEGVAQRL